MDKQKHLTLDSRIIIETKLNEGESFKAIGRFLHKDCTTISKEVKHHISFEKSGTYGRSFNDCHDSDEDSGIGLFHQLQKFRIFPKDEIGILQSF